MRTYLCEALAKWLEVLPDGVGRALIPGVAARRLLRGHDLDEAAGEIVEPVALLDVPMQRRAVELREQEDALEAGVEAVADRDIDDAVLARERHGRLGSVLRQRIKSRAGASAENDGNDVAGVENGGTSRHIHDQNLSNESWFANHKYSRRSLFGVKFANRDANIFVTEETEALKANELHSPYHSP